MKKFLWSAVSLYGKQDYGFLEGSTSKQIREELTEKSFFQILVSPVPERELRFPISEQKLLKILEPLSLLLDSGVALSEALGLLITEEKTNIERYIFLRIRTSLRVGSTLAESFKELQPMFSNFYVSMIELAEKTGKLREVLHLLTDYYQTQNNRNLEVKKQLRYPKIVFVSVVCVAIAIVAFIVPMFENLFALYQGELPITTQGIIFLSDLLRKHTLLIIALIFGLWIWSRLPTLSRLHPWIIAKGKLRQVISSFEDPLLFAEAMKILLESGQKVFEATKIASSCLSLPNQKYGLALTDSLKKGSGFAEAFKEIPWFPVQFHTFIASAEKAGKISVGFEQIYHYIKKKREEQFEKWSKLLEPIIMFFLGVVILLLLMSIYLPIFDLGNQFS